MFKYQVIKKALSFELTNFIFNYFLLKRDAVDFMYENNIVYMTQVLFGTWSDPQVPNTYTLCRYGNGNFNDESVT